MTKQLNLFPDIDDIWDYLTPDKPRSTLHTPRPYYPPKTLDSYVRMITCGKGFSGEIPADVIIRYNKLKKGKK